MIHWKKTVSFIICSAMIVTNSTISFASSYTDMSKHWSETYVKDIKEKQIISGYQDGSFKPDNSVSRIEAIIMITKLFGMQQINDTYTNSKSKWEEKLTNYNIPEWSWPYIVYGIENGIVPASDNFLASIMDQTKKDVQNNALRYEVVVYMVRAMKWESELAKTSVLKYKDISKIPVQAIPYIDIMIKKGIIGEKGDLEGNFNAQKSVTRAEMAVMLSNVYPHASKIATQTQTTVGQVDTQPTDGKTPTNIVSTGTIAVENSSMSVMDGTIELVAVGPDYTSFTISSTSGVLHSFGNKNESIEVKIGNQSATIQDLKIKDKVKILYEDNNKVRSIILANKEQKITGLYKGIDEKNNLMVSINEQVLSFIYDSNTKISIDNVTANIKEIKLNDKVELVYIDSKVTEIAAYAVNKTVEGVIYNIRGNDIIVTENGKDTRYTISSRTRIVRNNENMLSLDSLYPTDMVKIIIENGEVYSIVATSVQSKIRKGVIKEIVITPAFYQIVVIDSNNKEFRLDVDVNTRIRIDSVRSSISDLRIGHEVDIYADATLAKEIISDGSFKQSVFTGKVTSNDDRNGIMEIKDTKGNILKVYYSNTTLIENLSNNSSIRGSQIYKDDEVTVVGTYHLGGVEATKILVSFSYN